LGFNCFLQHEEQGFKFVGASGTTLEMLLYGRHYRVGIGACHNKLGVLIQEIETFQAANLTFFSGQGGLQ
jgi:hypothetical protein